MLSLQQIYYAKTHVLIPAKYIYTLSDEEAKSTVVLGKYSRAFHFKEMGEHPSIH